MSDRWHHAVLAGCLVAASCRSAPTPTAEPVPSEAPAPARAERLHPDTLLVRIHAAGRVSGDTRDEIQRGVPRCLVSVETTPNRHGAGIDSLFHMRCQGMRFLVRQAGPERRQFLETTAIESELAPAILPAGIRVGSTTLAQLRPRLGAPHEEQRNGADVRLTYRVPSEGAEEFITLHFARGVLRRVDWTFYVD